MDSSSSPSPPFHNWRAICALPDQEFKINVALAQSQEDRERMAQAFPELFTHEPPKHLGPWPVSVIRHVYDLFVDQDSDSVVGVQEFFLRAIGLPVTIAKGTSLVLREGDLCLSSEDEKKIFEVEASSDNLFPFQENPLSVDLGNAGQFYVHTVMCESADDEGDEPGDAVPGTMFAYLVRVEHVDLDLAN